MKQKGFTLAEVLVTLSIVGVIAAITGPLISKMAPDVTKITYLKTYDTLKEVIYEIINNPKYYPEYQESNGITYDYSEYPLANTSKLTLEDGVVAEGENKIATIMAYHMGLDIENGTDGQPNFTAKNGVSFEVSTEVSTGNITGKYKTDIYIDVDGPNTGKNCIYSSSSCKKPDVFKLSLTASGDLMPADAVGAKYVKERLKYKKKYKKEKIVLEDWVAPEDDKFRTNISEL